VEAYSACERKAAFLTFRMEEARQNGVEPVKEERQLAVDNDVSPPALRARNDILKGLSAYSTC
jgi:hypothetical protein